MAGPARARASASRGAQGVGEGSPLGAQVGRPIGAPLTPAPLRRRRCPPAGAADGVCAHETGVWADLAEPPPPEAAPAASKSDEAFLEKDGLEFSSSWEEVPIDDLNGLFVKVRERSLELVLGSPDPLPPFLKPGGGQGAAMSTNT